MRVRDSREKKGGGGGAPGANSTCWGDGETAVMGGGGYKNTGAHSFFYAFPVYTRVSSLPPLFLQQILPPPANLFPQGYDGFGQKSTRAHQGCSAETQFAD